MFGRLAAPDVRDCFSSCCEHTSTRLTQSLANNEGRVDGERGAIPTLLRDGPPHIHSEQHFAHAAIHRSVGPASCGEQVNGACWLWPRDPVPGPEPDEKQ